MDKEDVVQVVRCKDCEQCYSEIATHSGKRVHYCKMLRETFGQDAEVREDFFCQNGKRKEKRMLNREEREKVYKRANDHWGGLQRIVAIEEMQELGKEICKNIRGASNRDGLAEEIADVRIMLEQLELIYEVKDWVPGIVDQKVRRLEERLKKENG